MKAQSLFSAETAQGFLRLDGATGTELIKRGMPAGVCPEQWVIEHPEALIDVQGRYLAAGSDIVYIPSFGANPLKLAEFHLSEQVRPINRKLAEISRRAAPGKRIFGDIAPTGQLLEPNGPLSFEAAVAAYKTQAAALLEGGADGFAVETMMDLQEARAALIAIRELTDLPVIVTMTFEAGGRTLTGTDPVSALAVMQSLGADAFGCNCSTGPEDMAKLIAQMKPFARIPLVAKPNAGIPHLVNGKTVFNLGPDAFAEAARALVKAGANLLGGCCGTSPEHIAALSRMLQECTPIPVRTDAPGLAASASKYQIIASGEPFTLIGERINPTGKKALQKELREGKFDLVEKFAEEQTAGGADILDVNFGLAGADECALMKQGLKRILSVTQLPLCIDSTDPETVETALRLYPGRALLNSISAEKKRLEKILPVAAKYGAMLILLPLSDEEVPADCAGRKAALERILTEVRKYHYVDADLVVDALIMTISADPHAAEEALKFIESVNSEYHLGTTGGLSNISFGMPGREVVNLAFLGMGLGRGLSSVIANPSLAGLNAARKAADVLLHRRNAMDVFLTGFANLPKLTEATPAPAAAAVATATPSAPQTPQEALFNAVVAGKSENTMEQLEKLIAEAPEKAGLLVNEVLIPAINEVGRRFETKEYYLPQLLAGAGAMERAMKHLEPLLAAQSQANDNGKPKLVFVIATVKGDIHDIGKNIVILLLKNHGFKVVDLGKDVPATAIVEAAKKHRAAFIGLSALMTTTMPEMKNVTEALKAENLELPVLVGGAAVDEVFAKEIGAYYAADAMGTVRLAQKLSGMENADK